jgi:hypothetical protein
VRHRQTKGVTDRPHLHHRATSRLYPIHVQIGRFRYSPRSLGTDAVKCSKALGDKGLRHIECYQVASVKMAYQSAVNRRVAHNSLL